MCCCLQLDPLALQPKSFTMLKLFVLPSWLDNIKVDNLNGSITNSDLDCAGLLFLYLIMDGVCSVELGSHVDACNGCQYLTKGMEKTQEREFLYHYTLIMSYYYKSILSIHQCCTLLRGLSSQWCLVNHIHPPCSCCLNLWSVVLTIDKCHELIIIIGIGSDGFVGSFLLLQEQRWLGQYFPSLPRVFCSSDRILYAIIVGSSGEDQGSSSILTLCRVCFGLVKS